MFPCDLTMLTLVEVNLVEGYELSLFRSLILYTNSIYLLLVFKLY